MERKDAWKDVLQASWDVLIAIPTCRKSFGWLMLLAGQNPAGIRGRA
jgi:hypothetical protein